MAETPRVQSERSLRSLVNFGVCSLARVTGVPAHRRLRLRCECGARDCHAAIEVTRAEYLKVGCSAFLVAREHRPAMSGDGSDSDDRFRIVRSSPDDASGGGNAAALPALHRLSDQRLP